MMAESGDSALSFPHRSAKVANLHFVLPFPPSVNRYYRHVGYRTLLSREGREYRKRVCSLLARRVGQPLQGHLEVQLDLFPPDRRRRDFDNFQKGIWDSLQHAGVYADDSQIKRAVIEMHAPDGEGRAEISIQPREPCNSVPTNNQPSTRSTRTSGKKKPTRSS
ncbi:RusA family crossover junction endodeoxyribonuclease [Thalassoglobus sp.]|uniref:RusA family crossover junction endodeoxyribonuclease n=1 Tax=Thalassoglobus sp. TaxID=2795869 RepID=UPI003AA92BE7